MREGWKYKKLGEVGQFQRGKGIQKKDFVSTGMPCIHYGQIHTAFGVSTSKHISSIEESVFVESVIAKKGDVLLALTSEDVEGSCKCTAWLGDYDVAISSDAALYRHSLNPKFVVYYTKSKSFYIEKAKYARGFKVTHIKTSDIETIPIPVPPLPEQQRIVSELDLLSSIIDKQKVQLKELDKLAQSIFYDMFGDPVGNEKGWEVEPLSKFGNIITGNTPSRSNASYYDSNDIEWIKTENIIDSEMHPSQAAEYLSFAGLKVGRKIKRGSLLVACIAGSISSIGKCCITNKDVSFNQQINGIEPFNDKVDIHFLYGMISNTKQYLQAFATSGMKHILTKSVFQQIKLPLPPLSLQHLFAEKIQAIESQKASITQSIAETQKLFDYTMDKYFG